MSEEVPKQSIQQAVEAVSQIFPEHSDNNKTSRGDNFELRTDVRRGVLTDAMVREKTSRAGRTLHQVTLEQRNNPAADISVQSATTSLGRDGSKPTRYFSEITHSSRTYYAGGDDWKTDKSSRPRTTVSRYDKQGNVIYEFTSEKPELADAVIRRAAGQIINTAHERLGSKEKDIAETIEQIKQDLPNIAQDNVPTDSKNDVVDYLGKSYSERAEYFRDNPDDYQQHAPKWHQYGIITHSYEFARAINDVIPGYIKNWGLEDKAEKILSQRIDGVAKRQLLEVAGLLHDVGKFSSRTEEIEENSIKGYSFTDHEKHSGKIIRDESNTSNKLNDLGFTSTQIEYVARCAELHFELGKVRRASKENGGYTMAFVDTPAFHDSAQEIIDKNPDFALEIGLLFMADNISKSQVQAHGTTDGEIESEVPILVKELAEKGLNPNLVAQAKQIPINLKVARAYLTQWVETQ